jgi:hypothetical protein
MDIFIVGAVAIAGTFTYLIFKRYFETRRIVAEKEGSSELRAALKESNELNAALLARLDSLEIHVKNVDRALSEVG